MLTVNIIMCFFWTMFGLSILFGACSINTKTSKQDRMVVGVLCFFYVMDLLQRLVF